MNKTAIGIFAPADAGKTTLSESILYNAGVTDHRGRVDSGDAFLDTDELEKERGITIFSKEAFFTSGDTVYTIVDTPGHDEFSAEAERAFAVLDAAVIVVSGSDGPTGRTERILKEAERFDLPVFFFVNKCDLKSFDMNRIRAMLQGLSPKIADIGEPEAVALTSEDALAFYDEAGLFTEEALRRLVSSRLLYPCFFGSALKNCGVEELIEGLGAYIEPKLYGDELKAVIYKISKDQKNVRLTHVKLLGGALAVRDMLNGEKVTGIRKYSGASYELCDEAEAGGIYALTGLRDTYAGQGIGTDDIGTAAEIPLNYKVELPDETDVYSFLGAMKRLSEEFPELNAGFDKESGEIRISSSGKLHQETIRKIIKRETGADVTFTDEAISYRETIKGPSDGIGHYEPLRHYAEVHVRIEPLERGSGTGFSSEVPYDVLESGKQSTVLNALASAGLRGVLTGAPLTDVKIILTAVRTSVKHTEGADLREAAVRAVRHALMNAESVLLEPVLEIKVECEPELTGRISADVLKLKGRITDERTYILSASDYTVYARSLASFLSGRGSFSAAQAGYEECADAEAVIEEAGYDPESDTEQPASSVFCEHSAAVYVPWQEVADRCHIAVQAKREKNDITYREIEDIFNFVLKPKNTGKTRSPKLVKPSEGARYKGSEKAFDPNRRSRLIVDGYNIIFSWDDLKELMDADPGAAREKLIEILANYSGYAGEDVTVVFDAYRVKPREAVSEEILGIEVVYTGENETADSYIEKYVFDNLKKENITVATSDRLEQMNVFGGGAARLSARELNAKIAEVCETIRESLLL